MRILLILLLFVFASSSLWAEPPARQRNLGVDRGIDHITLDEAVSLARQRIAGRVTSAETRIQNGQTLHQIRILTPDGVVRRATIDAATGRLANRQRPVDRPNRNHQRLR